MWGSLIGAVFGALVGGGVTYYVQRRLEARRRHEETLEELYQKVFKLSRIVSDLTAGTSASPTESVPYPKEARELAHEVEELATDLWDEDLKRDVITAMNREYDSPEEICWQLEKVEIELRERAYPTLYDIKPEGRETPSGVALRWLNEKEKFGDWVEGWRGPAKIQFVFRMKERGRTLRVEEESD